MLADLDGRTRVDGLFAVGEVACTGVHGANRLASNSITEGLVAARRCADLLAARPARRRRAGRARRDRRGDRPRCPADDHRGDHAGTPVSSATRDGLTRLAGVLAAVPRLPADRPLDLAAVEATALHTVASLLARRGARRGPESRGAHRRSDAPDTRPEWEVRLVHRLDGAGHVHTRTAAGPRARRRRSTA